MIRLPYRWRLKTPVRLGAVTLCGVLALALGLTAFAQQQEQAQQPAPATTAQAPAPDAAQQPASAATPAPKSAAKPEPSHVGEINEAELKQQLVGKPLFLLGGYLNDTLSFNERGALIGHSPKGSYTLCGVQIDKVRFTKHKVELEGARYGLHFLGALPTEDLSAAVDRVRITPRKKELKITIDRELVATAKKEKKSGKRLFGKQAKPTAAPAKPTATAVPPETAAAPPATAAPPTAEPNEPREAEQIKAEIAAAPAAERPADPGSVTRTTSPAHANQLLKDTLEPLAKLR